jgi:hypothetical protein
MFLNDRKTILHATGGRALPPIAEEISSIAEAREE